MSHVRSRLAALLVAMLACWGPLCPEAFALQSFGSAPLLKENALTYAPNAGSLGHELATGVDQGSTVVVFSPDGDEMGADSWSEYDEFGRLIIFVDVSLARDTYVCLYLMLHEQAHHWPEIDPDPPMPPPPGGDDTPTRRALACSEAAAECETFFALWILFAEVPCATPADRCKFIRSRIERWKVLWEECNNNFFIGNYCPEALLLLSLCP